MTKCQERRRAAYLEQLKRCGFRSWKQANHRRGHLIHKKVYETATEHEIDELAGLQRLADLYVTWKTNDSLGRSARFMNRKIKKLEAKFGIKIL